MILIIDNFDSFVYNLQHYVERLGFFSRVIRNNALTTEEIKAMKPSHIILSPGPSRPETAGVCVALIEQFMGHIPILGVCLGHQAIGYQAGAKIIHAKQPRHGKDIAIEHMQTGLFEGLTSPIQGACYHSLAVERASLGDQYLVDAWSEEGEVMSIRHKKFSLFGLQFHPESILTPQGLEIIDRFLKF